MQVPRRRRGIGAAAPGFRRRRRRAPSSPASSSSFLRGSSSSSSSSALLLLLPLLLLLFAPPPPPFLGKSHEAEAWIAVIVRRRSSGCSTGLLSRRRQRQGRRQRSYYDCSCFGVDLRCASNFYVATNADNGRRRGRRRKGTALGSSSSSGTDRNGGGVEEGDDDFVTGGDDEARMRNEIARAVSAVSAAAAASTNNDPILSSPLDDDDDDEATIVDDGGDEALLQLSLALELNETISSLYDTNATTEGGTGTAAVVQDTAEYRSALLNLLMEASAEGGAEQTRPLPLSSSRGEGDVGGEGEEATMEDLMTAVREQHESCRRCHQGGGQQQQQQQYDDEELHRLVFANEPREIFLNQSRAFLESLSDPSRVGDAAALRRGRQFRQRQEDAAKRLEREIADLEDFLLRDGDGADFDDGGQQEPTKELCEQCGCTLTAKELDVIAKHGRRNNNEDVEKNGYGTSRRVCQVCYGEILAAQSDWSFRRDAVGDGTETQFAARLSIPATSRPKRNERQQRNGRVDSEEGAARRRPEGRSLTGSATKATRKTATMRRAGLTLRDLQNSRRSDRSRPVPGGSAQSEDGKDDSTARLEREDEGDGASGETNIE